MTKLKQQIVDYANNDEEYCWLTVQSKGHNYRFPKRALIHFVFGKMNLLDDILPPYEAFSHVGLKLPLDNPFHSDVWIGAGFDIKSAYKHGSDKCDALHEAVCQIEKEFKKIIKFDFTILANGMRKNRNSIRCMVYEYGPLEKDVWSSIHVDCAEKPKNKYDQHRCIVIPNAGIEYDLAARNADVVITEVGGQLAHLSTISREKGKLLIRIPGACKRFKRFSKFQIDLDELTITPT